MLGSGRHWYSPLGPTVIALAAAMLLATAVVGCGDEDAGRAEPGATLWVARSGCEDVTRVGPDGEVAARIDVGCELRGVAVGAGGVWFSSDAGSVIRVDPESNDVAATIPVGARVGALAIGAGDVWASDLGAPQVVRIDADTNAITARIDVGSEEAPVVGLVATNDAVWAIEDFSLALVRIDPLSNTVTGQVPLCETGECRVGSAAVGEDRAWVVDCCTGETLEIDPVTLDVTTNAHLEASVWELTGSAEGVWALHADSGQLVRLAPNRTEPEQVIETNVRGAHYPQAGAGSVWFYASDTSEIVRVTSDGDVTRPVTLTGVRAFAVSD